MNRYIDLPELTDKEITAASFADVLRIHLLREFGGVWVDATLYCNRPLDEWLWSVFGRGFFAFAQPGPDRELSTWFLAATPHNLLVSRWFTMVRQYWAARTRSSDYFWFHHLFGALCATDSEFAQEWRQVPKLGADAPHAIQTVGMASSASVGDPRIDWTTPVFKLSHRLASDDYRPKLLAWELLESTPDRDAASANAVAEAGRGAMASADLAETEKTVTNPVGSIAAIRVSTQNLGDHLQILAALQLLRRFGIRPSAFIDRDYELEDCSALRELPGPIGMLIHGWFKNGHDRWPPSEKIAPIFFGFHIRLFQSPALMSPEAVDYYRRQAPIGCRDVYTLELLSRAGVECFETNCVTLTLHCRLAEPSLQTELFVVSRDRRLLDLVPEHLGPRTYLSHYTDTQDFGSNLLAAKAMLERYRNRARLIVTTFLHCALPAIAMGIPTIVFYPVDSPAGNSSDVERFSALAKLVHVHHFDQAHKVNWNPKPVDVAALKLSVIDQFASLCARWGMPGPDPVGPFAPESVLPAPESVLPTP